MRFFTTNCFVPGKRMFSALFNFCCRQIKYDVKKPCVYFQQSSCVFNVPEMHLLFGKTTFHKMTSNAEKHVTKIVMFGFY